MVFTRQLVDMLMNSDNQERLQHYLTLLRYTIHSESGGTLTRFHLPLVFTLGAVGMDTE
jgi:hypothetical protein